MDNELTWLALALLALLFFGSKRLPDMARSLGRSLRIFQAETKGLTSSQESPVSETSGAEAQRPPTN